MAKPFGLSVPSRNVPYSNSKCIVHNTCSHIRQCISTQFLYCIALLCFASLGRTNGQPLQWSTVPLVAALASAFAGYHYRCHSPCSSLSHLLAGSASMTVIVIVIVIVSVMVSGSAN